MKRSAVKKKRGTSATAAKRKATQLWGEYVHLRDVYCQYCGRGDGKLDAHHILRKEHNATRADENNGVLLCAYPCHRTVIHGDSHKAECFYHRHLGTEAYRLLREKAYNGTKQRYPKSFWDGEIDRLKKLLGEL